MQNINRKTREKMFAHIEASLSSSEESNGSVKFFHDPYTLVEMGLIEMYPVAYVFRKGKLRESFTLMNEADYLKLSQISLIPNPDI